MANISDRFLDSRDFRRIARAIRYIERNFREQPRLATIAASAQLSEFHFNRLFRRWAGVTPRQYLAFVTARAARASLSGTASVLEAAYAVGLSGPGRLHDLMVTLEAVTPGELKARGSGLDIRYGFTATPFGTALLASTGRGLCHLSFHDAGSERAAVTPLAQQWREARLTRDDARALETAQRIWCATPTADLAPLRLAVKGTNFQLKVWQALLEVAARGPTTYRKVAQAVGICGGERAVGNAVGRNPIAWLIPCHNVLRTDGSLGGYAWGDDRKRAMLAWGSRDIILDAPERPRTLQSTG
ncbi:MAG TPA: methylated-DNA--[protein]-cysteine S-methyltransferase [Steroidobacteraceae bacterium]|nr:methylated-DNA--[protein]-cysteine S-methyltransferase [Steroidobacteraceae bacterium]